MVKKLTNMVLKDYGVDMFDNSATKIAEHSSTHSIKETDVRASRILKPIEDLAEQKR